jgi:hypothetical protein
VRVGYGSGEAAPPGPRSLLRALGAAHSLPGRPPAYVLPPPMRSAAYRRAKRPLSGLPPHPLHLPDVGARLSGPTPQGRTLCAAGAYDPLTSPDLLRKVVYGYVSH